MIRISPPAIAHPKTTNPTDRRPGRARRVITSAMTAPSSPTAAMIGATISTRLPSRMDPDAWPGSIGANGNPSPPAHQYNPNPP
ncbi:hypothetical protein GCM10011576_23400 [Micromonospora parathelypteridis]|nr:hypothetical protein GCM10011576_23400 [Micromonospora parathelypteridis]